MSPSSDDEAAALRHRAGAGEEDDDDDDDDGRELYTIPSSSRWFRWDEIHETERRALPEFFEGASASRNPRIYKEYRDFIITKYREDPLRRLAFSDVRRCLIGDIGRLRKVFSSLEEWGLINFRLKKEVEVKKEQEGPEVKVVLEEGPIGGVQVVPAYAPKRKRLVAATPSGVAGTSAEVGGGGFKLPPLTSYSDVFGDAAVRRVGAQCTSGGSDSLKGQPIVVRSKCSQDKSQKEIETTNDSKDQVDAGSLHGSSLWTDTETLLLLEAVLKHGDDWDLIAQHVRTKNKLDCISRLINLPFGEHILGTKNGKYENKSSISEPTDLKKDGHVINDTSQGHNTTHQHKEDNDKVEAESLPARPSKKRHLSSFLDATDSLMKQVDRLSIVIGPDIAAAAAEAAVSTLCDENPCARRAFDINEDHQAKKVSSDNEPSSELRSGDQFKVIPTQNDHPTEKSFGVTMFRIRASIAKALGAAAARAKLLADQEDHELELLMSSVVEAQMKKIQYKMKHLEELELIMEKEYTMIQKMKEDILEEWVKVLEQAFDAGIPRSKDHGLPKSLLNNITQ